MARLANTPAPRGQKPNADSSGLVDLAALMAEQPNWLDDALARAKASAGSAAAPPSVTPVSLAATMTDLADDRPSGVPRKGSLPIVLAATGAGLLVAAACVFALRVNGAKPAAAPLPPVAAVAHLDQPLIPPPPSAADVAATEPGAAQVTASAAPVAGQAQARATESDGPPVGRHWRHERHEARVAEAHVAPVAAKAADAPPPPPPARAAAPAAPPPAAPHSGSALDAALRASVGNATVAAPPPAADPTPAAAAPKAAPPAMDGRPERPSGSAVTGTLTEVLNPARKCVVGMSDASRALVTFGSDGAAHKIDVTGPAASDPGVLKCLKTAFSKAHVPPFSSPTYSAGVTIRPQ
jgi:hypothetical protein